MPRPGANATAGNQPGPGALFGFPGVTRWSEQIDTNDSTTSALTAAGAGPITGQIPFRQSDIVFGWKYFQLHVSAFTPGTDVVQTSQYFPYNITQAFQLNITNLYNMIDLQSIYDLAVFNFYRPVYGGQRRGQSQLMTNPAAFPYNPQTSQLPASGYSSASTAMTLEFDVPAMLWMDEYIDLDQNGNPRGVAHRVPVSPLYMSGTAREVTPAMSFSALAPGPTGSTDASPFVRTTVGTGTYTDTITHRWQRVGIYGTRVPAEMPQVFNWRYALASKRFGLSGVSQIDIPIKTVVPNGGGGQLLSVFFRFFDPNAGTGNSGLPIALTNISRGKLLYGSSLIRFDDNVLMMQKRVNDKHDVLLGNGIWLWDMAVDDDDRITNAKALNLYTTDVIAHFDFTGALSSSAYVVVGTEVLTYVLDQPILS